MSRGGWRWERCKSRSSRWGGCRTKAVGHQLRIRKIGGSLSRARISTIGRGSATFCTRALLKLEPASRSLVPDLRFRLYGSWTRQARDETGDSTDTLCRHSIHLRMRHIECSCCNFPVVTGRARVGTTTRNERKMCASTKGPFECLGRLEKYVKKIIAMVRELRQTRRCGL
jgi:hypothetical protein